MRLTLTQRLSLVFAVLLLVCCGTSAWMQVRSNQMHEQEVVQGLSRDLAQHIASDTVLMDTKGLMPGAVRDLFSQLMLVNPSVEVYLLDTEGKIVGSAAPEGRIHRERVDLAPIQRLLRGDALPIPGDDPRSVDGRKVFSAAPLKVDGKPAGYLYVVLLGEDHDRLAERGATSAALNTALLSIGLVALLCLIAGLTAFALITRPLRRLTETVSQFDIDGVPVTPPTAAPMEKAASHDEIAILDATFRQMQARLSEQWRTLTRQDQERRELVANISHDLRTPLASLHGYLETLSLKDATLSPADRRRYLGIALDQSRKVGGLAQSLLELVRLEHGFVQPVLERFSLTDLAQDIFLRVLSNRDATQPDTLRQPRAYLARIANCVLVSWRRRHSLEQAWLEALAQVPEPEHPSPEQQSVILETLHEIDAVLDTLRPRVRQAFLMATLDGMKQKDIAQALNIALPTVKKYIHEGYLTCLSQMPDD